MTTCGFFKKSGSIVLAVLTVASVTGVQAEPKKDVTDPVLKEVIASFESRMPRFIKKHGNDVFVAEDKITRGGLLLALYEYEHSLKIPQKNYVTRQELDEVKSRLALIEKMPAAGQGKPEKTPSNIVSLLNELQPNMPVLLDNTLNDSKVFKQLRDEIRNRPAAAALTPPAPASSENREQTALVLQKIEQLEQSQANTAKYVSLVPSLAGRRELAALTQRIETLELRSTGSPAVESARKDSERETALLMQRIERLEQSKGNSSRYASASPAAYPAGQREIAALAQRVEILEQRNTSVPAAAVTRKDIENIEDRLDDLSFMMGGSASPGEGRQASAFLTKVGVGLGMVAAFMAAR